MAEPFERDQESIADYEVGGDEVASTEQEVTQEEFYTPIAREEPAERPTGLSRPRGVSPRVYREAQAAAEEEVASQPFVQWETYRNDPRWEELSPAQKQNMFDEWQNYATQYLGKSGKLKTEEDISYTKSYFEDIAKTDNLRKPIFNPPNYFQQLGDQFNSGFMSFESGMAGYAAGIGLVDTATAAEAIADRNRKKRDMYMSPEMQKYTQDTMSGFEAVGRIVTNPWDLGLPMLAQSTGSNAPAILAGLATGATASALTAATGPGAAAAGIGAGLVGGAVAGGGIDTLVTYDQRVADEVRKRNLDPTNAKDVQSVLDDPNFVSPALKYATGRGAVITAAQLATFGLGKVVSLPATALSKAGVGTVAKEATKQFAIQEVGEGVGEFGAQVGGAVAAGEPIKISGRDIAEEVIIGAPMNAVEGSLMTAKSLFEAKAPQSANEVVRETVDQLNQNKIDQVLGEGPTPDNLETFYNNLSVDQKARLLGVEGGGTALENNQGVYSTLSESDKGKVQTAFDEAQKLKEAQKTPSVTEAEQAAAKAFPTPEAEPTLPTPAPVVATEGAATETTKEAPKAEQPPEVAPVTPAPVAVEPGRVSPPAPETTAPISEKSTAPIGEVAPQTAQAIKEAERTPAPAPTAEIPAAAPAPTPAVPAPTPEVTPQPNLQTTRQLRNKVEQNDFSLEDMAEKAKTVPLTDEQKKEQDRLKAENKAIRSEIAKRTKQKVSEDQPLAFNIPQIPKPEAPVAVPAVAPQAVTPPVAPVTAAPAPTPAPKKEKAPLPPTKRQQQKLSLLGYLPQDIAGIDRKRAEEIIAKQVKKPSEPKKEEVPQAPTPAGAPAPAVTTPAVVTPAPTAPAQPPAGETGGPVAPPAGEPTAPETEQQRLDEAEQKLRQKVEQVKLQSTKFEIDEESLRAFLGPNPSEELVRRVRAVIRLLELALDNVRAIFEKVASKGDRESQQKMTEGPNAPTIRRIVFTKSREGIGVTTDPSDLDALNTLFVNPEFLLESLRITQATLDIADFFIKVMEEELLHLQHGWAVYNVFASVVSGDTQFDREAYRKFYIDQATEIENAMTLEEAREVAEKYAQLDTKGKDKAQIIREFNDRYRRAGRMGEEFIRGKIQRAMTGSVTEDVVVGIATPPALRYLAAIQNWLGNFLGARKVKNYTKLTDRTVIDKYYNAVSKLIDAVPNNLARAARTAEGLTIPGRVMTGSRSLISTLNHAKQSLYDQELYNQIQRDFTGEKTEEGYMRKGELWAKTVGLLARLFPTVPVKEIESIVSYQAVLALNDYDKTLSNATFSTYLFKRGYNAILKEKIKGQKRQTVESGRVDVPGSVATARNRPLPIGVVNPEGQLTKEEKNEFQKKLDEQGIDIKLDKVATDLEKADDLKPIEDKAEKAYKEAIAAGAVDELPTSVLGAQDSISKIADKLDDRPLASRYSQLGTMFEEENLSFEEQLGPARATGDELAGRELSPERQTDINELKKIFSDLTATLSDAEKDIFDYVYRGDETNLTRKEIMRKHSDVLTNNTQYDRMRDQVMQKAVRFLADQGITKDNFTASVNPANVAKQLAIRNAVTRLASNYTYPVSFTTSDSLPDVLPLTASAMSKIQRYKLDPTPEVFAFVSSFENQINWKELEKDRSTPELAMLNLAMEADRIFEELSNPEKYTINANDLNFDREELALQAMAIFDSRARNALKAYRKNKEANQNRIVDYVNQQRKESVLEWKLNLPDVVQNRLLWPVLWKIPNEALTEKKSGGSTISFVHPVVKDVESAVKESGINTPNVSKTYKQKLVAFARENVADKVTLSNDREWVYIPSQSEDPDNFTSNVAKYKMLSASSWCTSRFNAEPYLKQGGAWILINKLKPEAAVRLEGDQVAEIQDIQNRKVAPIPDALWSDIVSFLKQRDLYNQETTQELIQEGGRVDRAEFIQKVSETTDLRDLKKILIDARNVSGLDLGEVVWSKAKELINKSSLLDLAEMRASSLGYLFYWLVGKSRDRRVISYNSQTSNEVFDFMSKLLDFMFENEDSLSGTLRSDHNIFSSTPEALSWLTLTPALTPDQKRQFIKKAVPFESELLASPMLETEDLDLFIDRISNANKSELFRELTTRMWSTLEEDRFLFPLAKNPQLNTEQAKRLFDTVDKSLLGPGQKIQVKIDLYRHALLDSLLLDALVGQEETAEAALRSDDNFTKKILEIFLEDVDKNRALLTSGMAGRLVLDTFTDVINSGEHEENFNKLFNTYLSLAARTDGLLSETLPRISTDDSAKAKKIRAALATYFDQLFSKNNLSRTDVGMLNDLITVNYEQADYADPAYQVVEPALARKSLDRLLLHLEEFKPLGNVLLEGQRDELLNNVLVPIGREVARQKPFFSEALGKRNHEREAFTFDSEKYLKRFVDIVSNKMKIPEIEKLRLLTEVEAAVTERSVGDGARRYMFNAVKDKLIDMFTSARAPLRPADMADPIFTILGSLKIILSDNLKDDLAHPIYTDEAETYAKIINTIFGYAAQNPEVPGFQKNEIYRDLVQNSFDLLHVRVALSEEIKENLVSIINFNPEVAMEKIDDIATSNLFWTKPVIRNAPKVNALFEKVTGESLSKRFLDYNVKSPTTNTFASARKIASTLYDNTPEGEALRTRIETEGIKPFGTGNIFSKFLKKPVGDNYALEAAMSPSSYEAYYDPNNGNITFVLDNIKSEQRARELFYHEATHGNVWYLKASQEGRRELSKILQGSRQTLLDNADQIVRKMGYTSFETFKTQYGFKSEDELLGELLARYAEQLADRPAPSWLQNIADQLALWFKQFFGMDLSGKDVLTWLSNQMQRNLAVEENRLAPVETSPEIAGTQRVFAASVNPTQALWRVQQKVDAEVAKKMALKTYIPRVGKEMMARANKYVDDRLQQGASMEKIRQDIVKEPVTGLMSLGFKNYVLAILGIRLQNGIDEVLNEIKINGNNPGLQGRLDNLRASLDGIMDAAQEQASLQGQDFQSLKIFTLLFDAEAIVREYTRPIAKAQKTLLENDEEVKRLRAELQQLREEFAAKAAEKAAKVVYVSVPEQKAQTYKRLLGVLEPLENESWAQYLERIGVPYEEVMKLIQGPVTASVNPGKPSPFNGNTGNRPAMEVLDEILGLDPKFFGKLITYKMKAGRIGTDQEVAQSQQAKRKSPRARREKPKQLQQVFDWAKSKEAEAKVEEKDNMEEEIEKDVLPPLVRLAKYAADGATSRIMRMLTGTTKPPAGVLEKLEREVRKLVLAQFQLETNPVQQDPVDTRTVEEKILDLMDRVSFSEQSFNQIQANLRIELEKDTKLRETNPEKAMSPEERAAIEKATQTKFDGNRILAQSNLIKDLIDFKREVRLHATQQAGVSLQSIIELVGQKLPKLNEEQRQAVAKVLYSNYEQLKKTEATKQLERLLKKVRREKPVEAKKEIEAMLELFNLGAFNDEKYYNAIAERFGLPKWNEETVAKLRAEAEAVSKLPVGSDQRNTKSIQLQGYIARELAKSQNLLENKDYVMDVAASVWKAGVLSGLGTQAVNLQSTFLNVLLEAFTDSFAAYFSLPRDQRKGVTPATFLKDALGGLIATIGSKGWQTAMDTFATGTSRFRSENQQLISPLEAFKWGEGPEAKGVKPTLGRILNNYLAGWKLVGRAMGAADTYNSTIATEAKLRIQSRLALLRSGLKPEEVQKELDKLFRQSQEMDSQIQAQVEAEAKAGQFGSLDGLDPKSMAYKIQKRNIEAGKRRRLAQLRDDAIENRAKFTQDDIAEAERFTQVATFNNKPVGLIGFIADSISNMVGKAKMLTPFGSFMRTTANIVNSALNYTPYGFLRAYGFSAGNWTGLSGSRYEFMPSAQQRNQLAVQATLGTVATGVILGMVLEDLDEPWDKAKFAITLNGPQDPQKRLQLLQTGWRPLSVKFMGPLGPVTFRYTDLPGLSLVLGIFGRISDEYRYGKLKEKDLATVLAYAGLSVGNVIFEKNLLLGAKQFFDLVSLQRDPLSTLQRVPVSYIGGFTNPGITRWLTQTVGMTESGMVPQIDYERLNATFPGYIMSFFPVAQLTAKPKLNRLGEPITQYPWAASTKRIGFIPEMKPHPVFSPLVAEGLFVPGLGETVEVQVFEDGKRTQRRMTEVEFYDYAKYNGEYLKRVLTPERAQALAELAKTNKERAQDRLNELGQRAKEYGLDRIERQIRNQR